MSRLQVDMPAVPKTSPEIEELLEQFDAAWKRGQAPQLESFLPSPSAACRRHVLEELIKIDLEYCWRQVRSRSAGLGESEPEGDVDGGPRLEDYVARFPGLHPLESLPLDLIGEEYRVRSRWGDHPKHAEYTARFGWLGASLGSLLAEIDAELIAERAGLNPVARGVGSSPIVAVARGLDSLEEGQVSRPCATVLDKVAPAAVRWPTVPGYEILEELGRGGMGVVYKARQQSLKRLVALKMIRSGELAGPDELARFHREAEMVAQLRHPHIVQIYEIGRHQDQPFFALELLEGGGLDQQLKGMPQPPREAAQLVEILARAMQAAHERGIIHRDLKPSNILLQQAASRPPNSEGEAQAISDFGCRISDFAPKITDFGLAKRLDATIGLTQSGAIVGTPSYMAPEQAQGQVKEITVAADIYALGAILYEMLTGRPPFLAETPLQTLLLVRSQEPVPPRRLQPTVRRDLEIICLKCLHKEPKRRYDSAEALAEDLRRYQAGEPIKARPAGNAERLWRWCRRKPALASVALLGAILLIVLASGIPVLASLWLRAAANAQRAENEYGRAEQNLNEARQLVEKHFTLVCEMELSKEPGTQALQKRLLESAREHYQRFLEQRPEDPAHQEDLAMAHWRVGLINSQIGSMEKAIEEVQYARNLLESLVEQGRAELQADLARCCYLLGRLQADGGHYDEGVRTLERSRDLLAELLRSHPNDSRLEHEQGNCLLRLGRFLSEAARPEAQKCLEESVQHLENVVRHSPDRSEAPQDLAEAYRLLGTCLRETKGQPAAALPLYQRALELQEQLARANPANSDYQSNLAGCLAYLGDLHSVLGQPQRGLPFIERALDIMNQTVRRNPGVGEYERQLGDVHMNIASLYYTTRAMPKAINSGDQARAIYDKLARKDPTDTALQSRMGTILAVLGSYELGTGKTNEAAQHLEQACAVWEKLVKDNPKVTYFRSWLAASYGSLGDLDLKRQPARALAPSEKALAIYDDIAADKQGDLDYHSKRGTTEHLRAEALAYLGRFEEAISACQRAIKADRLALDGLSSNDYRNYLVEHYRFLAWLERKVGRPGEAATAALSYRKLWPANPHELFLIACDLAACVPLVGTDKSKLTPKQQAERQRYTDQAMELVREAIQHGFKDVTRLKNDPAVAPLRECAEFRKLLALLEGKGSGAQEKSKHD
jgi:tetratricopeptide (TPR) repeat protein